MDVVVEQPQWYAISTRSRVEKVVAATLAKLGVECFLPLVREERQWSDRKKVVSLPLFPGYLFVQSAETGSLQSQLHKVPGIVLLVGNNAGPLPISEQEIFGLRDVVSRGAPYTPHPYLRAGVRVRIVHGAFTGIEGIVVRNGKQSKVVISVELIKQAVSVEVGFSEVQMITASAA
jgi:transcription antitermination factor NusG